MAAWASLLGRTAARHSQGGVRSASGRDQGPRQASRAFFLEAKQGRIPVVLRVDPRRSSPDHSAFMSIERV